MNINSKSGSGSASTLFAILFLASIALNAAFLTGCISMDDIRGGRKTPTTAINTPQRPTDDESFYLREIAGTLGLSPSSDKRPGEIAFDIKQSLNNSQKYRGDVLSDAAFEECKAAIPTTKDTETFETYHAFIKKIVGKKILVLGN